MERKEHTLINVISTVSLQIITLLSGFIIPKLILDAFGSEVNGLISSITQFLGYISLIEGGVSAVILANLYRPLATGDNDQVSAVVSTADSFFKKIALIFGVYQVVLAIGYPFIVKSSFDWGYIASMVLILGISTLIQYSLALSWRLLLQADKRMYIAVLAQGVAIVLNLALTFVLIKCNANVHIVKLISGVAFILQPMILYGYIRKNYTLSKATKAEKGLLSQRWDGFGINIAAMIRASTATVVLSVLTNLSIVSVFSVYVLVSNGMKSLITSISGGIVPNIGSSYAKGDLEGSNKTFDNFDFIMFLVSFFCFTVAAVAIPSFALVYTSGLTDANYNQPLLGVLLMAAECIFCIREPYVNMAYSAGHFRQVSKYAYIEAGITVVLSVIFTLLWGLVGVAIALLVSAIYRTFAQVYYLKGNILCRKPWKFLYRFICFGIAAVASALVCYWLFEQPAINVFSWIIYAVKVAAVTAVFMAIASVLCCREQLKPILRKLRLIK